MGPDHLSCGISSQFLVPDWDIVDSGIGSSYPGRTGTLATYVGAPVRQNYPGVDYIPTSQELEFGYWNSLLNRVKICSWKKTNNNELRTY